ncbi:MAG: EFR1 family ferrodoxin [Blautia sp.]
MSIYKITFSPTGGTQRVADIFAEAFQEPSTFVDLTDRSVHFSDIPFMEKDICVVAVPSYGGRVPETAASRIRQMRGRGAKAILVVAYGNRAYEDTLLELKDLLTAGGFQCEAGAAAVTEHSIMHQFATGRPDREDCQELVEFAEEIVHRVKAEQRQAPLKIPGNKPYRKYGGIPLKPKAAKECIRCGLCAEKCPVGAISEKDPKETDKKKCISCMRCVNICPKQARKVNSMLVYAASLKMKKTCSTRKKNEWF